MAEIKITEGGETSTTTPLDGATGNVVTPKYEMPQADSGSAPSPLEGLVGIFALVILGFVGVVYLLSGNDPGMTDDTDITPASELPGESNLASCHEPVNPYDPSSSEEYAGFAWGESGKSCTEGSADFLEGCQAYLKLSEAYIACNRPRDTDSVPL